MWAIGEPSGPIENGTTYIVRPRIEPLKSPSASRASRPGSRQLLVGPASSSLLGADERAVLDPRHVAGIGQRQVGFGRLASVSCSNVPASTSSLASRSYSSAEPSHQSTSSGWVSVATSSTHSSSF